MQKILLSCKKAALLIEKKHSFGLNPVESAQLSMHKKLCDICSSYEEQNKMIDQALDKHIHDPQNASLQNMSEEEKSSIKEKLHS